MAHIGDSGIREWIRGSLIGTGAFGRVNLALNKVDGQVFAVKSVEVDANDGASKACLSAIENEIALLPSLDSKYVVRCLGSDWTEESGKVVRNVFLEYMPGGCLTDFLKQFVGAGPIDERLVRTYTRGIVQGIEYLHSNGIVHCDIKGKNILVGEGSVKLTDFGSAKRVGEVREVQDEVLNRFAKVNGTPLWMAPEVVNQVEQGPASDIWSLGCTVLEMATGKAPWSNLANPLVALYHIGCTDETPAIPAWLSSEARDFLAHCFHRDPRSRWTSAQLLQHPFLTTQVVAIASKPLGSFKAVVSPTSVLHSSNDSSSEFFSTFKNPVPILSMPPTFRRGTVRELPSSTNSPKFQERVEDNGWGCSPCSPAPLQWIVVRSPKDSPPPCFSHFSNMMAPVVEDVVPKVGASNVALKSESPISSGVAAVAAASVIENSDRTYAHEQCRCTGNFSSAIGCLDLFVADAETLEPEGALVVDMCSVQSNLSDGFLLMEEQSLLAESGCIPNRSFLASAIEDEAPCSSDSLICNNPSQSSVGSSELKRCQFTSMQEFLKMWHSVHQGGRYEFVQTGRNQLQQDSVHNVESKLGPWDHCKALLLFKGMSPMVKLRIDPFVVFVRSISSNQVIYQLISIQLSSCVYLMIQHCHALAVTHLFMYSHNPPGSVFCSVIT